MSTRSVSLALSSILLLACAGCAGGAATYGQDRLRDVADVADVRYGTGLGLGVSFEAVYFGTGLGCSVEWYQRQWFGRKSVEVRDGLYFNMGELIDLLGGVVGYDPMNDDGIPKYVSPPPPPPPDETQWAAPVAPPSG